MSDGNKSIVLPTFNRKDELFQVWWTKFRAFAMAKGVMQALLQEDPNMPATENSAFDPIADTGTTKPESKTALQWRIC